MVKRLCGLLCFILSACGSQTNFQKEAQKWAQEDGKVKVLSTTAQINDLVQVIGGSEVDAIALITGQLDPHSYELVKGDDEKIARADIIFYNGLGLEHGPSLKQFLKESKKSIGLGDIIRREEPELILSDEGQVDPHFWMDISLWKRNVAVIVKELSIKDPAGAKKYEERGVVLEERMQKTDDEIRQLLQSIPQEKRYIVTSHDAFNYFTRAYLAQSSEVTFQDWKKRFAAPEGLAPEGQISAKDIQEIIDHMKQYGITVLFPESNVSKDSIRKILDAGRKEGLDFCIANETLYGDAMGPPESSGGTYLGMIQTNAQVIASYLKGERGCESKK